MWEERAAALARSNDRVFAERQREEARERQEARRVKRRIAAYAAKVEAKAKAEAELRRQWEEDPKFAAARDRRRWFEACRQRYGNLMKSAEIADRVARRGPDDCWEWTGSRNGLEYGVLDWAWSEGEPQKQSFAHRVALGLFLGRRPEQMVLHSCDNAPCVNPAHLREGTAKENARDAVERNRWTLPDQESADVIRHLHFVEGLSVAEILKKQVGSRREIVRTLLGEKWRGTTQPVCCDECKPLDRSPVNRSPALLQLDEPFASLKRSG